MERVRGGSREGAGRPHNEGASQTKVMVFLGRDEDAREVKRNLEELNDELNKNGKLRDTIKLVVEHFRSCQRRSRGTSDKCVQADCETDDKCCQTRYATEDEAVQTVCDSECEQSDGYGQDESGSEITLMPNTGIISELTFTSRRDIHSPQRKKAKTSPVSESVKLLLRKRLLPTSPDHQSSFSDTGSPPSLRSSFVVGSDVSPITVDLSQSAADKDSFTPCQVTSTPSLTVDKHSCTSHQRTSTPSLAAPGIRGSAVRREHVGPHDMSVDYDAFGNLIVETGDTFFGNCDVTDEEETMIRDVVEDLEDHEPSSQYYSSQDPYFRISYGDISEELEAVKDRKCIAFFCSLKELLGNSCRFDRCSKKLVDVHFSDDCGYGCKLTWFCEDKHKGTWYSSPTYAGGFAVNHIVNASILFSGLCEQPFLRFCQFVGLVHMQPSSFYRYQKLYAAPTINQEYEELRDKYVMELRSSSEVVLSGDGRMDSPGFSAVKGTYSLMDYDTGRIIVMEHGDKRQVNLKSTNMEPHLFKKALSWLIEEGVPVKEVVTDANVQIISILKKQSEFKGIFHSLDVWHKAAKLSAKLSEAAKKKQCKQLGEWIAAIRNHFWFICRECNGDEQAIRELWVSIIHHCCNSHKWAQGECLHGPMDQPGGEKSWLHPESQAAEALRNVVFDKRWLNSLPYYVRNRHTGLLESFHNVIFTYASKRVGFRHDGYVARIQLAYLDHNHHLNRPHMKTKHGKLVYTRKWGKRTARWHAVPIPVKKMYPYVPEMIAKTMYRRHMDKSSVRVTGVKSAVAKTLFSNIASVPAPTTSQLVQEHVQRQAMHQAEI